MPRQRRLVKNSEVIKVGDFVVQEGAGVANVDAKTEDIAGFCTGFTDRKGISLDSITHDSNYGGGSYNASTKTFTAASDNETDAQVYVEFYEVQENDQLVVTLDDDKGKTSGSDIPGGYFGISTTDSSLLDESDYNAAPANLQFQSLITSGENLGDREIVVRVIRRQSNL